MIQSSGDLIGLKPLEKKTHGVYAVCLARADILRLSAVGNFEFAAAEDLYIADDGTDSAIEQTVHQVFVAEQPSLVACLSGQAEDTGAAESLDSVCDADFEIIKAGIKSEPDGGFLTLLQRLASRFFGDDEEEELDLTLRQEARERRIVSDVKPFIRTLRVTNPVRQSWTSSRKRVLRGGG